MAGNAHRNRHGNVEGCKYCDKNGKFRNSNGHRRNLSRKKRQRKKALNIQTIIG